MIFWNTFLAECYRLEGKERWDKQPVSWKHKLFLASQTQISHGTVDMCFTEISVLKWVNNVNQNNKLGCLNMSTKQRFTEPYLFHQWLELAHLSCCAALVTLTNSICLELWIMSRGILSCLHNETRGEASKREQQQWVGMSQSWSNRLCLEGKNGCHSKCSFKVLE